ncbi:hypothetical protein HZS_7229 [Henneguya salminicola]|nr:hypothetical protein HZS_7229 [Henneguya salminicola]
MSFTYLYILSNLIIHVKGEENFDIISNQINHLANVKIFGYKNVGNTGPNNGCCGEVILSQCLPCQYSISCIMMANSNEL